MKRALLALAPLAVLLTTAGAAANDAVPARAERDRDQLIDYAREHGERVTPMPGGMGSAFVQDGLFDACSTGSWSDPAEGLAIDVLSVALSYDCATGQWLFGLTTNASFGPNVFDFTFVALDTDMNLATGDADGTDYTITAFFDDDGFFNLAIVRTPTSNSATWSVVGVPGFGQSANRLSLSWRNPQVGSPAQFRWYAAFATLVAVPVDAVPNSGYITTTTAVLPPAPPLGQPARFVPITPSRLMDTRNGYGLGSVQKTFSGATLRRTVLGFAGMPAGAVAVALNVTATEAEGSGFVTVFPNGPVRPYASNLNVTAGQTIANLVVSPIGSQGKVAFYTSQAMHLVADVMGYWVPAASATDGRYQPLNPARILDTRDGIGAPAAKVQAGKPLKVAVRGRGGVPPTGASAVVLNVTYTQANASGWAAAYPGGTAWAGASNINVQRAGQTIPNLVIVPLGADGSVNLLTLAGGHLVADVAGYFTDASAPAATSGLFVTRQPARILDTRAGQPSGGGAPQVKIPTGGSIQVNATAVGIPAGAGAALLNVTNTENNFSGFVTVYPAEPRPFASNLNMERANQTIPNAVVATLAGGTFRVFSHPGSHVVIDTSGYFAA